MYKVLIVDDEPIVREGLEWIIEWEKYNYQIIDTAENGKEGLEKIRSLKPDLVVTDIRMPEINGIEMIRQARNEDIDCECIILSGHSDFSYAQEAIELGMLSYLLKPIDEDELIRSLSKISDEIKKKKQIEEYQDYSLSSLVKTYIVRGQYNENLEVFLSYDFYQLIGCFFQTSKINQDQMKETMKQLLPKNTFVFSHSNELFALICDETVITVNNLVETLENEINQQQKNSVFILSERTSSVKDLRRLYDEIKELENKQYLFPKLAVLSQQILADEVEKKNSVFLLDKSELRANLLHATITGQTIKMASYLEQLFNYYQKNTWDVNTIKADLSNLCSYCFETIEEELDKPLKESEKNKVVSVIWSNKSLYETFDFLKEVFKDMGRMFYAKNEKKDVVEDIIQITYKQYDEDLTLQYLGKKLNYSHSYLGKKFKAQKQQSYRTFLDEVRIEKAKKLLREKNHLIYEISDKVGYANSDYFYKKFKKIVGMSPKSYQKQYIDVREGDDI
ncbi:response regulator transcription factor [Desemzia sp. RIT804]|uniref:response regulator transcription factor n=1 Tax=Desemzia sp. RIT 804 TaxID=2810209 RepID=UPI001952754D|nr:response regulator [Desemzia sp. RIT 804]MBM6614488.1 response regulator transcription factor [Desemzia sp. RIT 804]